MENRKILLVAAALLAIIKFVFLPWWSWQQEYIEALHTKSERFEKQRRLLSAQQEFEGMSQTLEQALSKLSSSFYEAPSESDFKLALQKQLESYFSECGVKVKLLEWVLKVPGSLTEYRILSEVEGPRSNVIACGYRLASWEQLLTVNELEIKQNRGSRRQTNQTSMTLNVSVYMKEPQA